jgi:DNA-binding SARP family transcriptional activator
MDGRWQIKLLGGLQARQGDRAVAHFRTRKTGVLLAYLAVYPHRTHPREELIELLWPECDPELGRQSFRKALSSLRCQLEPDALASGISAAPVFVVDRTSVQLNPAAVITDVGEFERALRSAAPTGSNHERARRLADAVALYPGELLPGYYDDWILQERCWLAETYFQALSQLRAHLQSLTSTDGGNHLPTLLIREMSRCMQNAAPLSPQESALVRRLLSAGGAVIA